MSLDTLPTCPLGLTADNLSGWRDGDLSPDRMQRIESHLAACATCQQRLAGFQRIADGLQSMSQKAPDLQSGDAWAPRAVVALDGYWWYTGHKNTCSSSSGEEF